MQSRSCSAAPRRSLRAAAYSWTRRAACCCLPPEGGLFQSAADGSALQVRPGPVDVAATGIVAVTLEPAAGVPQPTSQPIIVAAQTRSEEHTSELQSLRHLVC